jgi:ABC-2 type transport system ATP-binding protein
VSAVLELSGVSKRYGTFQALREVDLTIGAGEIFALLGPNGAGKTTLIGAVCGLVKKTAGTIRVFGVDQDVDPEGPRRQVGLVPQELAFDPFFTPREALRFQLGYYGLRYDGARVEEVLRALGLWDKVDVSTRALSGGMKRRLLVAKALVHRPKLVFLDEPTAGVDVELRRELWRYLRQIREQGTTIVLTTHYLEEAEELADRVGLLAGGQLRLVEGTKELMARHSERVVTLTFDGPLFELPPTLRTLGAELVEGGQKAIYREESGALPVGPVLAQLTQEGTRVSDVATRALRLEDVLRRVLAPPP